MENVTWSEEGILASDVWAIPKSLEPMSAQEERTAWRKTVKVLDNLCGISDALMLDPLILALTDALMRSKEELARGRTDWQGRRTQSFIHANTSASRICCTAPTRSGTRIRRSTERSGRTPRSRSRRSRSWRACKRRLPSTSSATASRSASPTRWRRETTRGGVILIRYLAHNREEEDMEKHTVAYTFDGELVSSATDEGGTMTLFRVDEDAYFIHIDMRDIANDVVPGAPRHAVLEVGCTPKGLSEDIIKAWFPKLLAPQSGQ